MALGNPFAGSSAIWQGADVPGPMRQTPVFLLPVA